MLKVIEPFHDPETQKTYAVGEEYPAKTKQSHIAYLMGTGNKIGKPLIEETGSFGMDYAEEPKRRGRGFMSEDEQG